MGTINLGGRPAHYKTPEELLVKVQEYFDNCPRTKFVTVYKYSQETDKLEPEIVEKPHYTKSGLCAYLGFADFTSIYDYQNKANKEDATEEDKQFSHIIKMASMVIADEYESLLPTKGASTGAIFALKNMGWKDRQDITTDDKPIESNVAIVPSRKDAEEWGK